MQEEKKESLVDVKGTLEKFIKADEPELEQEEAIMKYGEEKNKKKKSSGSEDDDISENSEEQEHVNRVKQELLASLKRVEALAKKIFEGNPLGDKEKINVKVNKTDNGGGKKVSKEKKEEIKSKKREQERE